ncbi:CFEM-domain-containing protein [Lophiostoma macrostomum CBS 122681]|uniref:CFEM-domain-containing protein n=1 Tax=Lophiostoma macrostomum CBS 122681 TaxID=1314788 RepID=A0A6A6T527_9PLEO|nr:CFEM-domain-containing protein [Lophiostoma macrostomum CBS 122681]
MKSFTAAAVIALASVVTAQLDNIPSCALNCFVTPLSSDGCSSLTDFACHCKKFDTLIASVTPCVQGACSTSDQQATIAAVEQTCADAGVSVSVSEPAGSSTAAASSSAGSSADSSAGSSAPASTAASSTSEASTAAASSTAVVTSTVSGAPTSSSNGTVSSSAPSSSTSEFSNVAAQATQAAGILGAAALALLAL